MNMKISLSRNTFFLNTGLGFDSRWNFVFLRLNLLLLVVLLCLSQSLVWASKVPSAVLDLNDRFMEVKDQGHWFVVFYAPWCGHCKKVMPTWEQMGHAMAEEGKVRIAKLDCTRFGSVCSEVGVHGYPTIMYFRQGAILTYEGDRTKAAFMDYASKLSGPEVRRIEDGQHLKSVNQSYYKGGYFVLVARPEDSINSLVTQYESAAKELFHKAYFYVILPELLPNLMQPSTVPTVLAVHKEGVYSFDPEEESEADLGKWLNKARWPLFPEITFGNLYDMGLCCDRLIVIACLDMVRKKKPGTAEYKFGKIIENTALKNHKTLENDFQFGWTDGHELADNVVLGSMAVPSMLILNVSTQQFYLPDDPSSETTEESLLLFLQTIRQGGRLPMGGKGIIQRIKRAFFEIYSLIYMMFANQPLLSCCLFGLPTGIIAIICYTLCSADMTVDSEEIYRDSDEEDENIPPSQEDPDHEHWE